MNPASRKRRRVHADVVKRNATNQSGPAGYQSQPVVAGHNMKRRSLIQRAITFAALLGLTTKAAKPQRPEFEVTVYTRHHTKVGPLIADYVEMENRNLYVIDPAGGDVMLQRAQVLAIGRGGEAIGQVCPYDISHWVVAIGDKQAVWVPCITTYGWGMQCIDPTPTYRLT